MDTLWYLKNNSYENYLILVYIYLLKELKFPFPGIEDLMIIGIIIMDIIIFSLWEGSGCGFNQKL
ncbi:hypothetical protein MKMG_01509 [Methanogenium sp. MK-MG]|nr:hypothetical protein MKMG_01509 [Methanogenium sp. MK-MG]